MKRICVFCGSSRGADPAFAQAARQLGRLLAARKLGLVYGGGNIGLMGILADAALGAGGEVIGVIPQALVDRELAHQGLTRLHVVRTMHERKALMAAEADAFVALPGGYGTLEEFFEVLTWAQLGIHQKPCALLNINGFYDPLLAQVERGLSERLIRDAHKEMLMVETEPGPLLDRLVQARPPAQHKWIDRDGEPPQRVEP